MVSKAVYCIYGIKNGILDPSRGINSGLSDVRHQKRRIRLVYIAGGLPNPGVLKAAYQIFNMGSGVSDSRDWLRRVGLEGIDSGLLDSWYRKRPIGSGGIVSNLLDLGALKSACWIQACNSYNSMSIIKYGINIFFRTVVGFNILSRIGVCELDVTKAYVGGDVLLP